LNNVLYTNRQLIFDIAQTILIEQYTIHLFAINFPYYQGSFI